MTDNDILYARMLQHCWRNFAGISASLFPKTILGAIGPQSRQINERRTNYGSRIFYSVKKRLGFGQSSGIHFPVGDNQRFHLCFFKYSAAFSGSMVEISMPVPSSKPAQVEVLGNISKCQW